MAGNTVYRAILVYDISRWGRFQDTDEAAHYEFMCKSSGVPIHYCAEQFTNDDSLPNIILKNLKRTMAGEYSRELSVKVLAGQKKLCEAGFRLGSSPGYGLRRMLVSSDGKPKHQLAPREWKSITTDRVILVPGPQSEVKVVREIYKMLIEDEMSVFGIARELNQRGIKYLGKAGWSNHAVYRILKSPKYAGFSVFGRTSQKLKTPVVNKDASEWIVTPNAFRAIIDQRTFVAAQQVLAARTLSKTKDYLLTCLRTLLTSKGKVSGQIIASSKITPSPNAYIRQFGKLTNAYAIIGTKQVRTHHRDVRLKLHVLRMKLMSEIEAMFPNKISLLTYSGTRRAQLILDNNQAISVSLVRTKETKHHGIRWRFDATLREYDNVLLVARLAVGNQVPLDYFVFPPRTLTSAMNLKFDDDRLWRGILLEDLSQLLDTVKKVAPEFVSMQAPDAG